MRDERGPYRKSYVVPHGRGFKYLRAIPKDLQSIEKKCAWVKYLGAVSRTEAETCARLLAHEHGKRIAALRALSEGERSKIVAASGYEGEHNLPAADEPFISVQRQRSNKHRPNAGLMVLVDLWERIRSPRSYKGRAKSRLCVKRFIEHVGEMEPSEVTRAHVMAYRAALEKLPGMSAKNIGVHLSKLHVLFNVALSEGVVTTNPAHKIKAREIGLNLAPRRQGFTTEQVRAIFQALNGETEAFTWVVRILAYHGARSGEVCQLRCDDVTSLHAVPVLRIHDRHGQLKNRASVRDIPIHPACMRIVTFAADVLASHGSDSWLFPSLPAGESGRGSWFQRYGSRFLRHKVGITDRCYTMHSFRHLWRTLARECEMPESVSRAIMGHTLGGGEHGAYGCAPSLRLRAEWIARIDPLVG